MTYKYDGFNYVIRLNKDERLSEALKEFLQKTEVDGAWILGIGGAQEATLGFYSLKTKQYNWRTFSDLMEVTSLQGNIAVDEDGEPVFHMHGTFAGEDFNSFGGHVKDLIVGGTLEIFVHRTDDMPLSRKHDTEVGLDLLDL
ncbi:MAG TPA: PPC domain-containing DNA-binding protein [Candidatus Saccharimonadales bacterium]|nr:PPC domain-containing DNA-binding protein [Candidatus Saccharimonadales bacterium]